MRHERFWETKPLIELTRTEWESLCDGCAKCCLRKKRNGEPVAPVNLGSYCYLLDMETCRCSSYTNRQDLEPKCTVLGPGRQETYEQMPETCAYRLLHEGKPLPDWHPLITGDVCSALPHKAFYNGQINVSEHASASGPAPVTEEPDSTPESAELPAQSAVALPPKNAAGRPGLSDENPEQQLFHALDTIEAEGLTGNFIGTASHGIRTALNGIVGTAQLVADTQLTHQQRSCINAILHSSEELLKVVHYVLDISKLESGQLDICEVPLDLRLICNNLYQTFRARAKQQGITLQCTCDPDVPISVLCDARLIERVLENLIDNALEHTGSGSVILTVSCVKKGPKGAELVFKVIDTGAGGAASKPAPIGEEARAPGAETNHALQHRANMGLAVCRRLVELVNGTFNLMNVKDVGSMFCITLTLRQANNPAPIYLGKRNAVTNPNTRVLLAEDNKVNQQVAASILREAGCQVDTVTHGADAVRYVQDYLYDIILMDCQMPGMDGFEATRRIRNMDEPLSTLPIIALTAHAMKGDRQKCLDSGMNDYMPKPIQRQGLIDLINKYTVPR